MTVNEQLEAKRSIGKGHWDNIIGSGVACRSGRDAMMYVAEKLQCSTIDDWPTVSGEW